MPETSSALVQPGDRRQEPAAEVRVPASAALRGRARPRLFTIGVATAVLGVACLVVGVASTSGPPVPVPEPARAAAVGVQTAPSTPAPGASAPASAPPAIALTSPLPAAPSGASAAAPNLAGFRILPPAPVIPYCSTFDGTGAIPAGDEVLIFDQSADGAGQPDPRNAPYYYDGQAHRDGDGSWMSAPIEIGDGKPTDAGIHSLIYALLVPSLEGDRIGAVAPTFATPYFFPTLPQSLAQSSVTVQRNADITPC